jgi:hypothetical protein
MTNPFRDVAPVAALAAEPGHWLAHLADRLDRVHETMAPGATLECDLDEGVLVMGRHEVPGLALLFRHASDPGGSGPGGSGPGGSGPGGSGPGAGDPGGSDPGAGDPGARRDALARAEALIRTGRLRD